MNGRKELLGVWLSRVTRPVSTCTPRTRVGQYILLKDIIFGRFIFISQFRYTQCFPNLFKSSKNKSPQNSIMDDRLVGSHFLRTVIISCEIRQLRWMLQKFQFHNFRHRNCTSLRPCVSLMEKCEQFFFISLIKRSNNDEFWEGGILRTPWPPTFRSIPPSSSYFGRLAYNNHADRVLFWLWSVIMDPGFINNCVST